MKAKAVMKILRISNSILSRYLKNGWIKATRLPNNRYDYDEASVYEFLNARIPRKNYIFNETLFKEKSGKNKGIVGK